jgi:hypothetical protein
LIEAVSNHSAKLAVQMLAALGIATRAIAVRIDPASRNGRRRPSGPQVRSLQCPISGWTSSPVIGAAIHRIGNWSSWAPSVWKIRLVLPFCNPQTICTPNRPQHMFQICPIVSRGRRVGAGGEMPASPSFACKTCPSLLKSAPVSGSA